MERSDVVIVGAGPTGLMLAGELLLAGVRPVLLDRLAAPEVTPRANGLVGHLVRVLDQRALYHPLARAGGRQPGRLPAMLLAPRPARPRRMPAFPYGGFRLDLRDVPDPRSPCWRWRRPAWNGCSARTPAGSAPTCAGGTP